MNKLDDDDDGGEVKLVPNFLHRPSQAYEWLALAHFDLENYV